LIQGEIGYPRLQILRQHSLVTKLFLQPNHSILDAQSKCPRIECQADQRRTQQHVHQPAGRKMRFFPRVYRPAEVQRQHRQHKKYKSWDMFRMV
jgi:hypothetical protein